MYIPTPYFPNVPKMGDLFIDNIFLASDFPVLFCCKNGKRLFLCICRTVIEEQKWIVSEIDYFTLCEMIHNNISIHDAFKKGSCSCIVTWKPTYKKEKYRLIKSCEISDADLPEKEIKLDAEDEFSVYLKKLEKEFFAHNFENTVVVSRNSQKANRIILNQNNFHNIFNLNVIVNKNQTIQNEKVSVSKILNKPIWIA